MPSPMEKLKSHLAHKEAKYTKSSSDITDSMFPYVYHQASDPPIWQKAVIKYMPYRKSMEGMNIWIMVGEHTKSESFNLDTGESDINECFITNLNGPDEQEDVIALFRNQLERESGPNDFKWDNDVERIKYDDWNTGTDELTVEEKEVIVKRIEETEDWYRESHQIYAEWLEKKTELISLGIVDNTGRTLVN